MYPIKFYEFIFKSFLLKMLLDLNLPLIGTLIGTPKNASKDHLLQTYIDSNIR